MTRVELSRPRRMPALLGRVDTRERDRLWPLSRVFGVGAAVAAVVLIAVLTTGSLSLYRLVETRSTAAAVSTPALLAGQQLSNGLLDQEIGLLGYSSTGQPQFLEAYRAGLDSERAAVDQLRGLYPVRLRDYGPALDAVQQAAQAWRDDYAQPVLDRSPTAPPPEIGDARFERVRAEATNLVTELQAQRAVAAASVDAATDALIGASVAIAALLVVFVVAVGIGLRRAVLRPLSLLAAQVRGLVTGGLHQEVRAGGPREISGLGSDVDAMRVHIVNDLEAVQAVNRLLDEQARDLAQSNRDLERSNRDLEQFAYVASHDLQEPLRKVSSFCQLLQRRYGGQLDERADQYIEFAVDGAQRMQRLINDLLSFSRVGRTAEAFEPVDLTAAAKTAAAQLESAREEVDGTIEIGELPEVSGDAGLLRQLFVNLLGNALKFHREGVPPVVRVRAEREGAQWRIEVTDNGIGIEPEYAEKVFMIFQRLHPRESYAGTGIGLALVAKIVEFHGGRICVAPTNESGATIRILLPARTEEES